MNNEINCPVCGQKIKLEEHPQFKNRLVAYHDCRPGMGMVEVYQTDNPSINSGQAPAPKPAIALRIPPGGKESDKK